MSLYIGKSKVRVPKYESVLESKVPKAFFDGGGKFQNLTVSSMDGWFSKEDTADMTTMANMFSGCSDLTSVPAMDMSKVVDTSNMFYQCPSLTAIHMYGMKVGFDISASTKFTREALVEILNNLGTVTSTQTLTMGSTNKAKLTDDDIAIATAKGWSIS